MYQVPSEFIRQKATVVWFLTVEHAVAAFAGYLLGEALGGSPLAIAVCMALGLAVTTFKVQGLTLYRFLPLAVAFLARKLTGDIVEPEGGPATIPPWTARSQGRQVTLAIRDAEGRPIIYQEEVHTGVRRHGEAVPTELRSRVKP